MNPSSKVSLLVVILVAVSTMISCTGFQPPAPPPPSPPPEPAVVKIPVVVKHEGKDKMPEGSGIIIENISGECSKEVEDALVSRLADNTGYNVLTRRNLETIIGEADLNWEGRFNTETVNRLGELLGASLYVVGRVGYCGTEVSDSPDTDFGLQFTIIAALQIIDMETGRVVLSSSDRGTYIPRPSPSLPLNNTSDEAKAAGSVAPPGPPAPPAVAPPPEHKGFWQGLANAMTGGGDTKPSATSPNKAPKTPKAKPLESEPLGYLKIKAAQDLAGSFADKFFSRATWEKVEMWQVANWRFGDFVHLVKLGHCAEAVSRIEAEAAGDVQFMNDGDVAMYLHNYGVSLLCANKPKEAMRKLRSAYRVGGNESTLKMLDLAERVEEWSLTVEVDSEPEVGILLRNYGYRGEI